jgi:two-component system, chemotaxis family, sensor kinase CheA
MGRDPYKYFRIEARELLDALGHGALDLEKGRAGLDMVGKLLRAAHTLKGASRVVKQAGIAELAHKVEEELAPHRANGAIGKAQAGEILRLVGEMGTMLAGLDEPGQTAGGRAQGEATSTKPTRCCASCPSRAPTTRRCARRWPRWSRRLASPPC